MGRNPLAYHARGRINPHPKQKKAKYSHKRKHKDANDDETTAANDALDNNNNVDVVEDEATKLAKMEQLLADTQPKTYDDDDGDDDGDGDGDDDDGWQVVGPGEGAPMDDDEDVELGIMGQEESIFVGAKDASEVERSSIGPSALRSVKQLYEMPTREELQELNDTVNLFNSELFRFQMEEMLSNVRPHKTPQHVSECLLAIRECVTSIQATNKKGKPHAIAKGIVSPFTPPTESSKFTDFVFHPPERVEFAGSFETGLHCRPNICIDVVMEMPQACLSHADKSKFRYFHKKALYLCHILSDLKKLKEIQFIKFVRFQGDALRPALLITPNSTKKSKHTQYSIMLHVTAPEDFFKVYQLHPLANGLKWDESTPSLHTSADVEYMHRDTAIEPATPRYNLRLIADSLMLQHTQFLRESARRYGESFKNTVYLLKVWLMQRQMHGHVFGAFNGFVASMLLAHLLTKGTMKKEASPYQMFRKVMSVIATSEWDKTPLRMRHLINPDGRAPDLDRFTKGFLVNFIDPSWTCNLLGHMTIGQYRELQYEATRSLALLDSDETDAFTSLFLVKHVPEQKFDFLVHVAVTPHIAARYEPQLLDRAGNWLDLARRLVPELLRRALKDRIRFVTCVGITPCEEVEAQGDMSINSSSASDVQAWDTNEEKPLYFAHERAILTLGIVANPSTFARVADIHNADNPLDGSEDTFRSFWGEKATLRSLSDGSLRYAVVWDASEEETHLIVKWITLHILARHLAIDAEDISMQTFLYEPALTLPKALPMLSLPQPQKHHKHHHDKHNKNKGAKMDAAAELAHDVGKQTSREIMHVFDELESSIKGISSLPLRVKDFSGVSPAFRYTDPFPPEPSSTSSNPATGDDGDGDDDGGDESGVNGDSDYKHTTTSRSNAYSPLEVVLTFESSNKWPDDVAAIQQVKTAFLIKIARELEDAGTFSCRLTRQFLDVSARGLVFRIVLYVEREQQLLIRQASKLEEASKSLAAQQGKSQQEIAEDMAMVAQTQRIAKLMVRDFVKLPSLCSILRDYAVQMRGFATTARLAKRWIHAHMFSSYIGDELVELLVLSLFNKDLAYLPPVSGDVGFLRFLSLICEHRWLEDPLFVDPLGDISADERSSIRTKFTANRDAFPVMFVVSSTDKESLWSMDAPSKQVFVRLVSFARESKRVVLQSMQSNRDALVGRPIPNVLDVFRTPTEGYDVVLDVLPSANKRAELNFVEEPVVEKSHKTKSEAETKYKNLQKKQTNKSKAEAAYRAIIEGGVDPVAQFLTQVRETFSDVALFWFNELGGQHIYVSISPKAIAPSPFKKTQCTMSQPAEDGNIAFNVHEFATELAAIGEGIIGNITLRKGL